MPTLRVIKILEEIRDAEDGITMTEISERTIIPMSTLSPILKTLSEKDFVRNKDNKYFIGFGVFRLGNSYNQKSNTISIIKSYMREIVSECNEICQLGIYENRMVFYLEKVEPQRAVKIVSSVGTKLAANAAALGKALLSQFDDEYIRKTFTGKMVKYTENTTTDINTLIEQIREVREKKYAIEHGETSIDIRCVAIPLEVNGKVIAALSISIPMYRADKENTEKCRDVLLKYKKIIETALSGLE